MVSIMAKAKIMIVEDEYLLASVKHENLSNPAGHFLLAHLNHLL